VPKRSEQLTQRTVELSQQEATHLAVERAHIEQVFMLIYSEYECRYFDVKHFDDSQIAA
jgi:hypothetical protein